MALVKGLPGQIWKAALAAVVSVGATAVVAAGVLAISDIVLGPVEIGGASRFDQMAASLMAGLLGAAVGSISGARIAGSAWPTWLAGLTAYLATAVIFLKGEGLWGLLHIGLLLATSFLLRWWLAEPSRP